MRPLRRAVTQAIQQVDPAATVQIDRASGQVQVQSAARASNWPPPLPKKATPSPHEPAQPTPQPAPQAWPVPISEAARLAGVSARMVRHYESLGLLQSVARSEGGYRQYTEADVHTLHFIRRARDLGFSIEEITTLLALWHDRSRTSAQVKRIAQSHIDQLTQRIAAMQAMQRTLQTLVGCCQGDDRPDCPILDDLAGAGS